MQLSAMKDPDISALCFHRDRSYAEVTLVAASNTASVFDNTSEMERSATSFT